MPWWGWIVLGGLLLGAEMFAIDAQFYLIFIGVAALSVGLVELLGVAMPEWVQWLMFAGLSVTFMVLFRGRLYGKLRGNIPDMADHMEGKRVLITEDLAPGAQCRVAHRGTNWTAQNIGQTPITSGTNAQIASVDGLTLHVSND